MDTLDVFIVTRGVVPKLQMLALKSEEGDGYIFYRNGDLWYCEEWVGDTRATYWTDMTDQEVYELAVETYYYMDVVFVLYKEREDK